MNVICGCLFVRRGWWSGAGKTGGEGVGSQQPPHRETDRPVPCRGSVRFCSGNKFALFFVCQGFVNISLSLKDNKQQKPQLWKSEDASQIITFFFFFNHRIPCYFKLHILLARSHSLILFHFFFPPFLKLPPTPLPCRSVGTFARALDCSSSVRQPSLHMSAAAASRDITLVQHISHLTLSHAPHAAGRLYTVVQLSRFILINGRHLQKK